MVDVFLHDNAVLSISVNPKQSHVFASACESGLVSLYDLRLSNSDPIIVASSIQHTGRHLINFSGGAYQSCCFNPADSNLLAAGNQVSGLELLDLRMTSTPVLRYRSKYETDLKSRRSSEENNFCQNVMSVEFNTTGNRLAALRHKHRPVVYETNDPNPKFLFDHPNYRNTCTMKRCCFAGAYDDYFVTG